MRHANAYRKLGVNSTHRKAMFANMAVPLIQNEQIKPTLPKAKELRPFVERVITLSKRAQELTGDDAAVRAVHLRRQAATFFHAGNRQQAPSTGRRSAPLPELRVESLAALSDLFVCWTEMAHEKAMAFELGQQSRRGTRPSANLEGSKSRRTRRGAAHPTSLRRSRG